MNLVYSVLFSNVFHLMLLSVGGFVIVGYGISRLLRRNDIADGLWGTGFIVIALVEGGTNFFALSILSKLVVGLTILWGLRLSVYLWVRLLGKAEDKRYANWRKQWGNKEPIRSFLQIFLLQGLLMGLISTPIVWVLSAGETAIGPSAVFGSCVFLLGFAIETAADGQLSEFKRDRRNNGKLMTQGLWGIVRHPNYLGEILVWWGMFFIALNVPGGGVTVISPVLITFLLVKVSGIPMLDALLGERGGNFSEYKKQSPALVPITARSLVAFILVGVTLIALDFVWLNLAMGPFYLSRLSELARLKDGSWNPALWASAGVYICLDLGILIFCVDRKEGKWNTFIRGAVFGLVTYGTYELTNYSLLKSWPIEIVLFDILWGTFLCIAGSVVGALVLQRNDQ
jgi:steroid 5-alpha reductase family enzyme/uncharacterized membrane protein